MRILHSICLIILSSQLFAVSYPPVEKYSVANGLSHSYVTSLFLDQRGFLWIGTMDGLNRFDGYDFHDYQADPRIPQTISDDYILNIKEDPQGDLWCISSSEVYMFKSKSEQFISNFSRTGFNINRGMIIDEAYDKIRNQIYIFREKGLERIDMISKTQQILVSDDKIHSVSEKSFSSIEFISGTHKVIFFSSEDLFEYDVLTDSIKPFLVEMRSLFKKDGGLLGVQDGFDGDLWIYTKYHIWKYNAKAEKQWILEFSNDSRDQENNIIYIDISSKEKLYILKNKNILTFNTLAQRVDFSLEVDYGIKQKFTVTSFLEDKSGIYWVGTSQGLFKFNPFQTLIQNFILTEIVSDWGSDYITALCFDKFNNIWIGSHDGRLLMMKKQKNEARNLRLIAQRKLKSEITCISTDLPGTVMIGTKKGLFYIEAHSQNNSAGSMALQTLMPDQIIYALAYENDSIWISNQNGLFVIYKEEDLFKKIMVLPDFMHGRPVIDLKITKNHIWIVQPHRIIKYHRITSESDVLTFQSFGFKNPMSINSILFGGVGMFIASKEGLFLYFESEDNLEKLKKLPQLASNNIHSIINDSKGRIWISTSNGIVSFDTVENRMKHFGMNDGLSWLTFSDCLVSRASDNALIWGSRQGLTLFYPDSVFVNNNIPNIEFTEAVFTIKDNISVFNLIGVDTLEIPSEYHHFRINFAALDFWDPVKNQYKYSIEKPDNKEKWISINNQHYLIFSGLKSGYYKLCLKGSNNEGEWNINSRELIIHVSTSFWETRLAILLYMVTITLIFWLALLLRTKRLQKLNREYREKELIAKEIELQKEELAIKNQNITDSLNYAKRIQLALMPSNKIFKKYFPDSFILHMPKDIVSGDFYWINEVDNRIYFAAVDCTGHGVPGAFMSIIGFDLFRKITETQKIKQPADILSSLNDGFEKIFRDVDNITLRDGMDVAFCAVNTDMKFLEFAGAFNPLYLVRDNTITEVKGDRFSVGLSYDESSEPVAFNNHLIPLQQGDIIYIFTDGFADQFGGPEGKKYKYRRFRHLLLAIHQLPMERQIDYLQRNINEWRGKIDQVDDILVMGIRISTDKQ